MNAKIVAALSVVMLLCVSGMTILTISDDSDATPSTGTAANPLTVLNQAAYYGLPSDYANLTFYVAAGSYVVLTFNDSDASTCSVTSGYGIVDEDGFGYYEGYLSKAGTISVSCGSYSFTIISVATGGETFTVSFDSNGGSSSPSSQSVTSGNSISLPSPGTRSGYTFSGWYTASSGGTYVNSTGSSYTVTSNITLYAHWSQTTYSHTLSYNANGGSGAPSSQSYTGASSNYTFTVSSTAPTRSGYTFLGWSTSSSASSASYSGGSTISVSANATVTLYAVWQSQSYTVSFNSGDGSGTMSSVSASGSYSLPSSGFTAPSGYIFSGWKANNSGSVLDAGSTYNVASNVTFYAQWTVKLAFTSTPSAGFYTIG